MQSLQDSLKITSNMGVGSKINMLEKEVKHLKTSYSLNIWKYA